MSAPDGPGAAGPPTTLVIRLSSMGDVVLCGAVTAGLAPVTFLTRRAWAPLAAMLPGVVEVLVYEDLAAQGGLSSRRWTRVVDLHASPRSRRLALGLRAPLRRVERHDLRRRLRVWLKVGAPPPRVVERYAAAAQVTAAPRPWLTGAGGGATLGLVPGAHHPTKRWPRERFVTVAAAWPGPIRVLGGPGEEEDVQALVEAIGPRAEGVAERGFTRTLAALRECRVVVAGDTGLLHLAGALGVPTVGVFGPTTSRDGFWDPACGEAVERELPCRPCSLHGGPTCPLGDHACLRELPAEVVIAAVGRLAGRGPKA